MALTRRGKQLLRLDGHVPTATPPKMEDGDYETEIDAAISGPGSSLRGAFIATAADND